MRKFLSILLVLTLALSLTACGSEELGTKGEYQGEMVYISWAKAMFGSDIKLNFEGEWGENYEWSEQLADDTEAAADKNIFFSMERNPGANRTTYAMKAIKQDWELLARTELGFEAEAELTEEDAAAVKELVETMVLTEDVMFFCMNPMDFDDGFTVTMTIRASKEVPLSLSVNDVYEGMVFHSLPNDGKYGASYAGGANGEGLVLAMDNSGWEVSSFTKDMFTITKTQSMGGKYCFTIRGLKEGDGEVVLSNSSVGNRYTFCINSVEYTLPEDDDYGAETTSAAATATPAASERAAAPAKETNPGPATTSAAVTTDAAADVFDPTSIHQPVEKMFTLTVTDVKTERYTVKAQDTQSYKEMKASLEAGNMEINPKLDINNIPTPELAVVKDISLLSGDMQDIGGDCLAVRMTIDDDDWTYYENAGATLDDVVARFGFIQTEAPNGFEEGYFKDDKKEVAYYIGKDSGGENVVVMFCLKNDVVYSFEGVPVKDVSLEALQTLANQVF